MLRKERLTFLLLSMSMWWIARAIPEAVIDNGRRALKILESASCEERVVVALASCEINDDERMRQAAMEVTVCFMKNSKRRVSDCDGKPVDQCTAQMSPHEFEIFTYFYAHLPAICLLKREHYFKEEASRLVADLYRAVLSAESFLTNAEEYGRELSSSLAKAVEDIDELRRFNADMFSSLQSAKHETARLLEKAVKEAENLRSRQSILLQLVAAAQRRVESLRDLQAFGQGFRDRFLLCAVLLVLVALSPWHALAVYGAGGIAVGLPLASPVLVLGLAKRYILPLYAGSRSYENRRTGAYTIETSTYRSSEHRRGA